MYMDSCWILNNGDCLELPPEGKAGYIYQITVKGSLPEHAGKFYIGKKAFTHKKKKTLSKSARKGTRKRVSITQVDSNWQNYWGSSKELLELIKTHGKEHFERKVLYFCDNKSDLNYWEAHFQFKYGVLLTEKSFNKWISVKVYRTALISPSI